MLREKLLTGERILWRGQPHPRRLRRGFEVWLVAIPWTVLAVFMAAISIGSFVFSDRAKGWLAVVTVVLAIFTLPLIAVGGAMRWKPIGAMRDASRTLFALTDRQVLRVLAKANDASGESHSVFFNQMGPIRTRHDGEGWGDV